ncbi:SIS domain-containing protein [bacterium]|nr:SIS domain-containing protein [bacterium]
MNFQGKDLAGFPDQIAFALQHFDSQKVEKVKSNHIVICGMGGSGIAGRITKTYFKNKVPAIIEICSDYSLPASVSSNSLVICSSYSGNTEETLACYHQAQSLGCNIIVLTGGGTLQQLAKEHNHLMFPAVLGLQPRMALGYSLSYLLLIVGSLYAMDMATELHGVVPELKQNEKHQHDAQNVMESLHLSEHNFLQVVTDSAGFGMAIRLQQQLNENSKMWAHIHEMPEMCHNVIEAIVERNNNGPWLLINSQSHERINMRFNYLQNLLEEKKFNHRMLHLNSHELPTLLRGIYTFDWLSLLIAHQHQRDSSQIPNILGLKAYLS